jgi:magnesium transporter
MDLRDMAKAAGGSDYEQFGANLYLIEDEILAMDKMQDLWPDLHQQESLDDDKTGVEIHKHHVFIQLAIPQSLSPETLFFKPIKLYFDENAMVVVVGHDNKLRSRLCDEMEEISERADYNQIFAIVNFVLRAAIEGFRVVTEEAEATIERMEEAVLTEAHKGIQPQILTQRKYLLRIRHNCEQVISVCENLYSSNECMLDANGLRALKITMGKANRVLNEILLLRDFLAQVREAYDAERDIKANELMKVFTVITSIFFPLTLLAGWYGMNFRLFPEIKWAYGYPMAIGLSVFITLGMLVLFKIKKWM